MAEELVETAELLLRDDPSPARFAEALTGRDLEDVVRRALDPDDGRLGVVAWPGQRLHGGLMRGDLIVRGQPGQRRRVSVVGEPHLLDQRQARAAALVTAPSPGHFVRTLEPGIARGQAVFARRIAGPDGLILPDITILRGTGEGETLPAPVGARPIIRQGSRGPAVATAQTQLNTVHQRQQAEGGGIDRCPLAVDGMFGPNTRAATLSFQRFAFPAAPAEWDGIIGPRTWAMLDLHARTDAPPRPPIDPPNIPPIIPIVFRPLDPPRWAPILGGLGRAPIRAQNAVRSLVDGPETYRTMLADLRRANNRRSFVYLLGWDCYDNFPLDPSAPSPCDTSLNRVLSDAVAAGAQVRAMVWFNITGVDKMRAVQEVAGRINALTGSPGNGACILDRRHGGAGRVDPRAIEAVLSALTAAITPLTLIPGIREEAQRLQRDLADQIERAARSMLASHHQKVLLIFDGERLVAYCGGIDFNPNRATTSTNCLPRSTPQAIAPSDPQHDTHCRIVGPAASDLLRTFVDRWLDHPDHGAIDTARGALRGDPVGAVPAPPAPNPGPTDAPHGASCSVVIARTYNPPAGGVIARQRDIATLLLRAIAHAENFIYFEDQYLWNFDTPTGATLALATALNRRLPRLRHVTAVIPANAISAPALFQRAWRLRFIEEVRRGHSREIASRFQVYQPNRGRCTGDGCLGAHTYVHSKCWVFDDELAVIGSANCNRRGYQHDSEVDAFVFDDTAPSRGGPLVALADPSARNTGEALAPMPTFAQHFRMRLWREHLGVSVFDGGDNSAWPTGTTPIGNVIRFRADRPLVINATADGHAFPVIADIAEVARPIFDPTSP
ncbi:peptidoglycan-binding protein [Sphingomonas sp.]